MVECSFPWLYNYYVLCCGPTHFNYLVTSSVSHVNRNEALKLEMPSNRVHTYLYVSSYFLLVELQARMPNFGKHTPYNHFLHGMYVK